mmetsp:Transcript_92184/g.192753  ORF Transcript_92184/g.192753 Transcript_92184/m.192753 type:complete len:125 (-) Transcript_92184:75-449(-)
MIVESEVAPRKGDRDCRCHWPGRSHRDTATTSRRGAPHEGSRERHGFVTGCTRRQEVQRPGPKLDVEVTKNTKSAGKTAINGGTQATTSRGRESSSNVKWSKKCSAENRSALLKGALTADTTHV